MLIPRLPRHLHTSGIRGKPCLSSPVCLWTHIMTGLGVTVFISVSLYCAVWPVSCRSGWMWWSVSQVLSGMFFVIGGFRHYVQQRPLSPDYSWKQWRMTAWHLLFPVVVEANLLLTFSYWVQLLYCLLMDGLSFCWLTWYPCLSWWISKPQIPTSYVITQRHTTQHDPARTQNKVFVLYSNSHHLPPKTGVLTHCVKRRVKSDCMLHLRYIFVKCWLH